MLDAQGVKWFHSGHARTGGVPKKHSVLHVASEHPPRLQSPQQLRGEIVHLFHEFVGVLVVTEVVVAGRVFVVIGEWDAGQPHVHAVFRQGPDLLHTIVMNGLPAFSPGGLPLYADGSRQLLDGVPVVEAVFLHNGAHVLRLLVVELPLFHQSPVDGFLRLGVNDVDDHLLGLEEAIDPVHRLDEIMEFVVDTDEDGPVTVPLEVAPAAGQALLGSKQPCPSLGEVDHPPLPLVVIHSAVDIHRRRQDPFQLVALRLQIMPQDEMGFRIAVHDLLGLQATGGYAAAFFPGRLLETLGGVVHQLKLPVLVVGLSVACGYHVGPHDHRRQGVARIVISQIRRRGEEQRPGGHPQPELFLLVWVQRQIVGLGAVPLKEPGEGLSRVHDLQESGIMNQLFQSVWRRRGRGHQLVFHSPEQWEKRLIGLAPEGAQHRRFVQTHRRESRRIDIPVPDPLIVGEKDPVRLLFRFRVRADIYRLRHLQQLHGVPLELLSDAQGKDDQRPAPFPLQDLSAPFQLLHRLSQAKCLKQRPAPTVERPGHRVPLMRFQRRMERRRVHVKPAHRRPLDLPAEKIYVFHQLYLFSQGSKYGPQHCCSFLSTAARAYSTSGVSPFHTSAISPYFLCRASLNRCSRSGPKPNSSLRAIMAASHIFCRVKNNVSLLLCSFSAWILARNPLFLLI